MKSKEVLASVIHHQDKQKAYDRYCKRIFSNKQILARLLKEYIAEYKTLSLKEIMKCLGNEKEEYISNLNLEDESVLGSLVRYDILFVADIPKSDKQQMINIEIQMNDRPRIPVAKASGILLQSIDRTPERVHSIWLMQEYANRK